MADMVLGALRVLLGLDTAAFSQGAKDAQRVLGGLDGIIKKSTGGLIGLKGAVAGLASGAFVAFLKSSVKVGEEIEKNSERLGVSAKFYQEISYAADIAGVSHEALTNALSKFQKGLGESSENVTKTEKALGQLGLTLAQLKALKPEDQFKLVADRLAAIEDPSKRANIGGALMSKTYGEVDAIMRLGASGIAKFALEARNLGFIL